MAGTNDNPLLLPVLEQLRKQPRGLSEYALLKAVEQALPPSAVNDDAASSTELALFQKHFLVMNALYQLQMTLWQEERLWLSISPLSIDLQSPDQQPLRSEAHYSLQPGGEDKLRDYYLDWNVFERTGGSEVRALLEGFWRRFHSTDKVQAAFTALQLEPTDDWATVQAQYRRLARANHPDRGGDSQRFLDVRAAYELLSSHFG